jgi:hypothetical protein
LEKRLNETIRSVPMSDFRKGLADLQDAARKKLASKAMFWNYTLVGLCARCIQWTNSA